MSLYVGSFDFKSHSISSQFVDNDCMTAIVAMLTPYGFIVGADGLRKDTLDDSDVTEKAQKIFPIESSRIPFAFAWAGVTKLWFPSGTVFDLIEATRQFASQPSVLAAGSFPDLILLFRTFLSIALAMHGESLPAKFFNSAVGRVLLLSYFEGQPCQAEVSVECGSDGFLQPKIVAVNCPARPQYIVFSGSEKMYKQFAGVNGIPQPETRETAIDVVRDYIQLCVDNRSTDPDCVDIGGHIHVGILNSETFEWIEPPSHETK